MFAVLAHAFYECDVIQTMARRERNGVYLNFLKPLHGMRFTAPRFRPPDDEIEDVAICFHTPTVSDWLDKYGPTQNYFAALLHRSFLPDQKEHQTLTRGFACDLRANPTSSLLAKNAIAIHPRFSGTQLNSGRVWLLHFLE